MAAEQENYSYGEDLQGQWKNEGEIERLLAAAPLRSLPPEAEQRLLAGLFDAASAPRRRGPWWARPVPLWQTAAACLLVALGSLFFMSRVTTAPLNAPFTTPPERVPPQPPRKTIFVQLDQPLFGPPAVTPERVDVRRWGSLAALGKGRE